jgi:hypothetical protein
MATFDIIVQKRNNFKGYTGEPPKDEAEYNDMKADMFDGTSPTWSEIQAEVSAYVDPKVSLKAKLIAGEPLTEEEASILVS